MGGDNRHNILESALMLFAARGYDAVAVQEVVDAAAITKPTLYHYFGSKEGLLAALIGEYTADFLCEVEQAAAFHGDLTLNLRGLVQVYFAFAKRQPTFTRMLLSMQHAPPESRARQATETVNARVYDAARGLFAAALPHFAGRHRRYAVTFIGMIHTYLRLGLDRDLDLNDETVYDAVHQFMHGIYS